MKIFAGAEVVLDFSAANGKQQSFKGWCRWRRQSQYIHDEIMTYIGVNPLHDTANYNCEQFSLNCRFKELELGCVAMHCWVHAGCKWFTVSWGEEPQRERGSHTEQCTFEAGTIFWPTDRKIQYISLLVLGFVEGPTLNSTVLYCTEVPGLLGFKFHNNSCKVAKCAG